MKKPVVNVPAVGGAVTGCRMEGRGEPVLREVSEGVVSHGADQEEKYDAGCDLHDGLGLGVLDTGGLRISFGLQLLTVQSDAGGCGDGDGSAKHTHKKPLGREL
jgi:hypothetical protein